MLSCDTFALGKGYFELNRNLFAKNSDRPLGEAQPISFFPGSIHAPGEMLQCTHLTIPQVSKTYTVLGCRPYWIWGFEMGVNECGLAIGNEAEGSRCEAETEEGLLGMDLLRLALERADNARKGIDVITSLLEQYGQNANANPLFDRRYENSFLLVDPKEIWLLETAGRQWAAKKIEDWAAISNCYSIGADFDLGSEQLEAYARQHRWLHPSEPFDFAKAYTMPAPRQGYSTPRWRRLCKLIGENTDPLHIDSVKAILRDHFSGELIEPRWGSTYGTFDTVCMHALTWSSSQTAASLLSFWDDVLGPVSWYSASVPCCSVFIPVYWTGDVPNIMKTAGAAYDRNALWWQTERLAMLISVDEERYGQRARAALRALEAEIYGQAHTVERFAREFMQNGKKDEARERLKQFTEKCAENVMEKVQYLANDISADIQNTGGLYGLRKEFLEDYMKRTSLPL